MCSRSLAIEKTACCDQPNAGTNAGNRRSALVPMPKPRYNRRVVLSHILDADSSGWYEDEVGFANGGERSLGRDLDRPLTSYRTSIDRGGCHTKTSSWPRSRQRIPQHPGITEHLHRSDGGRGEHFI